MKKNVKSLIAAVLCVASVLSTSIAAVEATDINSAEAEPSTTEIAIDELMEGLGEQQTTRALEEGEDWAINLIDAVSDSETLAGGYKLLEFDEQSQGKLYMNDGSKIVINAQNHKEDLQGLDIWADNACAMIKIKNITYACETNFGEPQKTTVCGYDAVMYDYDVIQYQFIDNTTKQVYDTYKGRNYYFYSDKNAYVIMFDTNDETWDKEVKNFEKFMSSLVVDGKENKGDSFNTIVIVCAAAAIVILGVVTAVVVNKNKKKAE